MLRQLRKMAFRAVSTRTQSRILGHLSDLGWTPAQSALMSFWVKRFGVNLEEAVIPPGGFDSFNAFFTRRLKADARPLDPDPSTVISPCDGMVQTAGRITDGMLFQAKGIEYRLSELLGESSSGPTDASRFDGGWYLTIYLSPGDYHRVHFPVSGHVRSLRHIPGGLLSVAPRVLGLFDNVFCANERVSGIIDTGSTRVGLVMVGATSVGRISLSVSDVVSNTKKAWGTSIYTDPLPCTRGDEYGVFNLGSTVIVLVGDGGCRPVHPGIGSKIRLGQAIFRKD